MANPDSGHARIITVTAYDQNFAQILSAGMHIDKVCKTEPKGKGKTGRVDNAVTTKKESK